MTPNLLPCPFCGEPASHGNGFSPCESIVYAWCSNNDCQLHLIDDYGFTPELWNTRAKAAPAEVPYALRQWAMDDEPESTLFDEGYNAARRWVKMQLEKPAEPTERILWYTGNTADPTEAVEVVATVTVSFDEGDEGSAIELFELHTLLDEGVTALMTVAQHKRLMADHSADDLTMVKVPRELLVKLLDEGRRAETWAAQDELRALLGGDQPAKQQEDPLEWSRKHGIEEF